MSADHPARGGRTPSTGVPRTRERACTVVAGEVEPLIHYPTPENDAEAAALVRRLEGALGELQLGDAERMAYELVRFHWRREGCRLEGAYTVLEGIATRNVGAALGECDRLRQLFAPAGRLAA